VNTQEQNCWMAERISSSCYLTFIFTIAL
jgi:hypothetical protein